MYLNTGKILYKEMKIFYVKQTTKCYIVKIFFHSICDLLYHTCETITSTPQIYIFFVKENSVKTLL